MEEALKELQKLKEEKEEERDLGPTALGDPQVLAGPRMYIFVNSDLGMGKGKIAAQVGHVVQMVTDEILRGHYEKRGPGLEAAFKVYKQWLSLGGRKIVLKASQQKLDELAQIPSSRKVYDAGKTQIPSGSLTVVGFFPCDLVTEFNEFKLL